MPNIFDGLRKISDSDLIEQVALLETINITNISKPIIQKAKKKTISIINFLGSKFGKSSMIQEPEVKEIWTLISEKTDELQNCTREELEKKLFEILVEKAKNEADEPTEDAISIGVIEEAAKLYKIFENLTPSQKADSIYKRYHEKLSGKAKEYINEQPFIDLQETTEDIEQIISSMDEQQKKEFVQSIEVEKLTFLNIWKKIDRQHYARLIWLAVKAYGGKFAPNEEMLPSFVEKEKEAEIIARDEELKESQKELIELKNKIEVCKEKINSIESNLKKENRLLSNAIRIKSKAEEDIIDLGKTGIKLETLRQGLENRLNEIKGNMENTGALEELDVLMEEFKKVKFESIDVNNKISDVNIEGTYKRELIEDNIKIIGDKEENIKVIAQEFQELKMEAANLIEGYNEKRKDVSQREAAKRSGIFESWNNYYNKFSFDFKNLSNIVNFSRKELIHIEECLYELHIIEDPTALGMGLIEGRNNRKEEYYYIDISFEDKFEVEIQYKVLNNEEKNVYIVEITSEF